VSVTPPSSWPWLDHPVSGLRLPTESPCSDSLSLRLPYSVKLAGKRKSLTHYTKGTPSSLLDWLCQSSSDDARFDRGVTPLTRPALLSIRPSPSTSIGHHTQHLLASDMTNLHSPHVAHGHRCFVLPPVAADLFHRGNKPPNL